MSEIQDAVRERYASKALQMANGSSCCDTSCCADGAGCGGDYSASDLASIGVDATASLGCGNPTLLADLHPGERVLDLGSGAGLDVLLSARRVAPGGHAFGVDMTAEMLAVAEANRTKAGVANATFLMGTIEAVPLPDASVDVIISNCVINLAADKRAVLTEAHRVLRPGGRFAVADMVSLAELPAEVKRSLDQWAGCVAGTISIDEYVAALREAGFTGIDVEVTREVRLDGIDGAIASAYIRARKAPGVVGSLELACDLKEDDRAARRDDWAAVEPALVDRVERDGQVIATYRNTPDVRAELERLMAAERECCPGATWDLRVEGDVIRTVIAAT